MRAIPRLNSTPDDIVNTITGEHIEVASGSTTNLKGHRLDDGGNRALRDGEGQHIHTYLLGNAQHVSRPLRLFGPWLCPRNARSDVLRWENWSQSIQCHWHVDLHLLMFHVGKGCSRTVLGAACFPNACNCGLRRCLGDTLSAVLETRPMGRRGSNLA